MRKPADGLEARRRALVDGVAVRLVDPPQGGWVEIGWCGVVIVGPLVIGGVGLETAGTDPPEGQSLEFLADVGVGGNVVVADVGLASVARVDKPVIAGGGVVSAAGLSEERSVAPHGDVAVTAARPADVAHVGHVVPVEGIDRIQMSTTAGGGYEQHDVAEGVGNDVGPECEFAGDIEQRLVGVPRCRPEVRESRHVAAESDVVLDDPLQGVDRLQADQRRGRTGVEGGV